MHELVVINDQHGELKHLQNAFRDFALRADLPHKTTITILIVLDEIVGNIIRYGDFAPGLENSNISVEINTSDEMVMLTIIDAAGAFDPLLAPEPDVESSLEEREIGGLGIHIVRSLVDSMEYCRDSDKNVLKLTCHILSQADNRPS